MDKLNTNNIQQCQSHQGLESTISFTNKSHGFTLIEIMITIALIGIITASAWPSFERYQIKNRRTDGISSLLLNRARLEKCFNNYQAFNNSNCTLLNPSTKGYYSIVSSNLTSETYTLTATPQNAQAGDGECATLSIDHLGVKGFTTTTTDPAGTLKRCWSQ